MGFAASTGRLIMLTARKSDLELELQFINQARTQLANIAAALTSAQSNLDPNSNESMQINSQLASIQQRDKILEMNAQRITKQQEAATQEIEAVSKVIDKNIQMTFGLMGQA